MRFKIKVCGLTRLRDALEALELGAGALGFVFYPPSPRFLTFKQAEAIVKKLPAEGEKIGVFVDFDVEEAERIAHQIGLTGIQVYRPQLVPKGKLLRIFAFRVGESFPKLDCLPSADYLLFDSYSPKYYGGSGQKFNWELLKKKRFSLPAILAGGLNAENVYQAILTTGVDAVDVSSGVEASPGVKDKIKLRKFIKRANLAFADRGAFNEKKNTSQ